VALEIVYETHATTTDNEAGVATGWLPGALSPRGRAEAAELGERRTDVSAVYASDLRRAVETAEIAFGGSGIPVLYDARLRECDYGDWNGMPVERLHAERLARVDVAFPGGESYRDVVARTASFLADLARERDGERVALVGHAANRWALDHLLKGERLEELVVAPFAWRPGWEYVLA